MARKDVTQSRAAQGGRQISASLSADEVAVLDAAKRLHPDLAQKDVILLALQQMVDRANALEWKDVRAWLDSRMTQP